MAIHKKIGPYEIIESIGAGGMGEVFRARDTRLDRTVAVKVLQEQLSTQVEFRQRFEREAKAVAALSHPNIVAIFDYGEQDGALYTATELLEGQTMRQRLDRGAIGWSKAMEYAHQIALGLAAAHDKGIVHRDLKPENLFITRDDQVKILDFGLAKPIVEETDGELDAEAQTKASHTQPGTVMGTAGYMSPEQVRAKETDHRSDIFALGAVFYEMLCGNRAFQRDTSIEVMNAILNEEPTDLTGVVDGLAPALVRIVRHCLEKSPDKRFQSTRDLAFALEALSGPRQAVSAAGQDSPAGGHLAPVAASAPEATGSTASIAVLPFTNMSADMENEYFSDGITEELIGALSKLPGLQVASRTSSFALKGKELDVRKIGEQLRVGSVLEGSVRKAGKRLRISTQLTDASNGYQLWSEVYDRELEDVFAIQDEISRAIVAALKVTLVGNESGPIVVPATENLEAYTLYLKGRFFRNKFTDPDLKISLEFYKQALEKDPTYGRAYAGIADTWMNLADDWLPPHEAYPKSKDAAEKAADLEPSLEEAHTSIGKILAWYDWDFPGAEKELRRVLEQNPNYADAHFSLGSVLPTLGRIDEAVEEMRKALELDALLDMHSRWLARMLVFARRFDEAIEQSLKTIEINPSYSRAYLDMGNAYLAQGKTQEALSAYRQAHAMEGSVVSFNASTARALAAMGKEDEVRSMLEDLEVQAQHRYLRGEMVACGYAAIGEVDKAFAWLATALEARSAGLIYLGVDPAYDSLRNDARFTALLAKVGLPAG